MDELRIYLLSTLMATEKQSTVILSCTLLSFKAVTRSFTWNFVGIQQKKPKTLPKSLKETHMMILHHTAVISFARLISRKETKTQRQVSERVGFH